MANLMSLHRTRNRTLPQSYSATALHRQDDAGQISLRPSKALGPISRRRVADILPHMKLVSHAFRPGLTVGFLRIFCNGLCTARRFHTECEEHTCRVGCPGEPDSLSHYNECPRLYNILTPFLGTCYNVAAKKSCFPRLDHPGVPAKPSIWNRGNVLH